ncbi:MAG: phage virion morphogenesis protein [Citrobacter sp.]
MPNDEQFVQGNQKLRQRIATIRRKLNLPVMVDQLGELLWRRTLNRFDRQVDPDGRTWKALEASTMRTRGAKGYPELPALRRSGTLRAAIKIIKGNAAGSTYTNTGAGVRIGIPATAGVYTQDGRAIPIVRVARYMNNGTPDVPARRFLGIGRLDVKAVDSYLRRRGDAAIQES